jgi:hypothetical protein
MRDQTTTVKVTAQDLALMLLALSRLDTGELSSTGNDSRNRLAKRFARAEERISNDDQWMEEINE